MLAVHVLHGEEGCAAGLADVVDGAGVPECLRVGLRSAMAPQRGQAGSSDATSVAQDGHSIGEGAPIVAELL